MSDVYATGFPRELDGHPLLAWMEEDGDWVSYVVLTLFAQLQKQNPRAELVGMRCTGEPQMETALRGSAVTRVSLAVPLEVELGDRYIAGTATFSGPEPRSVAWR